LKRLLIAACLLCTPALAANLAGGAWTILDYADTQCYPAAELVPKTPTPWLFNKYIRSEGLAATITEHKCGDQVASVTISVPARFQGLQYSVWFPSAVSCDRSLANITQATTNSEGGNGR
jgi:hypothetical protein